MRPLEIPSNSRQPAFRDQADSHNITCIALNRSLTAMRTLVLILVLVAAAMSAHVPEERAADVVGGLLSSGTGGSGVIGSVNIVATLAQLLPINLSLQSVIGLLTTVVNGLLVLVTNLSAVLVNVLVSVLALLKLCSVVISTLQGCSHAVLSSNASASFSYVVSTMMNFTSSFQLDLQNTCSVTGG
ncbi:uncharacterized protein LOC112574524 [Pomacea canaliculata]|uniref:uncharacterized protein LOC112574524 n=1 Tax=Pomacea canaliculata TaxID=400727 RepID=UPI000D73583A|nr:uncharacterized protein LOC112574524 [Pomacea canaliculata]